MRINCSALRPYIADKWHLDEVVVTSKGQQYYLWRTVDAEGNVLDVLLQRQRNTKAAERFFRKLLKKQGFVPRVLVTDKPLELRSRKQTSDQEGGASLLTRG